MGVYIKGIKMPDSCWNCPILDSEYGVCNILGTEATGLSIHKECPLVEVLEPHGRLIDAEKLKNEYPHNTDWDYPVNTNCYVCESIDNAPTVIEVEGE